MQTMRIAFFLYEGLTTLDIIGPHDVLSRLPDAEAISVGKTTGPFMADTGALGLDLVGLVDDLSEEFAAPAEAAGLQLGKQLPAEALPVCGDSPAVRRAVANLLANAVRLAPKGTTVTVSADRFDDWNFISVADEGPGIAPENHVRVFQRFWRGDRDQARQAGRSGLGLTIVRQIVESHGGRVDLASDIGRGSTFVLWFPRSVTGAVSRPAE